MGSMSILLSSAVPRLLANISTTTAGAAPTTQSAGLAWLDWVVLFAAGVGIVLAWRWGVFRRGSIRGPLRLVPGQSPLPFLGIALAGFLAGQLFGAVYEEGALSAARLTGTTRPATSPSTTQASTTQALTGTQAVPSPEALSPALDDEQANLTPAQSAKLDFGVAAAGLAVMLLIIQLRGVDGLERLGLTVAGLPRGIATGLLGAIAVVPWTILCVAAVFTVWEFFTHQLPENHPLLVELQNATDPHVRWLLVITAVIVAPLAEEIMFRGSLQQAFCLITGRPWAAVALTSLIFGLLHPYSWMIPPLFLLSMCLGYIYQRTGNLWATIAIHAAFNGLSVGVLLYGSG